MKSDLFIRNLLIIIVTLLALNIILPIFSSPPASHAAKNIEYKVLDVSKLPMDPNNKEKFSAELTEKLFNEYGKEGWEYIPLTTFFNLVIFKR